MATQATERKSAEVRREEILEAAMEEFAHGGLHGTSTEKIAQRAGISQPYLYRLYPNKEALFAAVVDHVSVVMTETLVEHSSVGAGATASDAARGAYAALVQDRAILRFLMHANCAAGEPLVGEARSTKRDQRRHGKRAVGGPTPDSRI